MNLVPRSQSTTDGIILRTASSPGHCDDRTLASLMPLAPLIVEAELARTRVTDTGLATLATFSNLRRLDLTRTGITSDGLAVLAPLVKLETLNLTATAVDDRGVAALQGLPALQHLWTFDTQVTVQEAQADLAAAPITEGGEAATAAETAVADGAAGASR